MMFTFSNTVLLRYPRTRGLMKNVLRFTQKRDITLYIFKDIIGTENVQWLKKLFFNFIEIFCNINNLSPIFDLSREVINKNNTITKPDTNTTRHGPQTSE